MLRRILVSLSSWLVLSSALCGAAFAAAPGVEIHHARSPATPPGSKVAAVYLEVTAAQPDRLLGASTPVAARVEIHTTSEVDGVMRMRPIESAQVTPDEPLKLEPGGMHLMLMELEEPLRMHAQFPLTLHFQHAGEVRVEVQVVAPGGGHAHH